jgi:hypothetical protein
MFYKGGDVVARRNFASRYDSVCQNLAIDLIHSVIASYPRKP